MAGVRALAASVQRPVSEVRADAEVKLAQVATSINPAVCAALAAASGVVHRLTFSNVRYDPEQVSRLAKVMHDRPVALLWTHRSYLDGLLVRSILQAHGLPRTYTAVGANLGFWPLGPLGRFAGAIFVRRGERETPVERFALGEYIAFLLSRGEHLDWAPEGTRSRTGKLMPVKTGLLRHVLAAADRDTVDGVALVPVAIVYDDLQELDELVAYGQGAKKQAEGLSWMARYATSWRPNRPDVHVRLGDPVLVGGSTDTDGLCRDPNAAAARIARELNGLTPATAPALVLLALHGAPSWGMPVGAVVAEAGALAGYARRWGAEVLIPDIGEPSAVEETVEQAVADLARRGLVLVEQSAAGTAARLAPRRALQASYYRNSVAHHFLVGAVAELAFLVAPSATGAGSVAAHALRIRSLLAGEFTFVPHDDADFVAAVRRDLDMRGADMTSVGRGRPQASRIASLSRMRPLLAHRTLRPFLEGYAVAADTVAAAAGDTAAYAAGDTAFYTAADTAAGCTAEPLLVESAQRRCRQLVADGTLGAADATSWWVLRNGVRLAAARRGHAPRLAAELWHLVDQTEVLASLAVRPQPVGETA